MKDTIYEMVHQQYKEVQKNGFFDAWGIVMNPDTIYELKLEVFQRDMYCYTVAVGGIEEIFGLVVIPHAKVEKDKAYVVDESLGRTILHGMKGTDNERHYI